MFIKRRTKLIRNHWRNGITGVENPLDAVEEERVIAPPDKKQLQGYFDRLDYRKESKYKVIPC